MKTIASANIGPVAFFEELRLQYFIAERAWKYLNEAAASWLQNGIPILDKMAPPGQMIMNCTVFLSAASVISKIIFAGDRKTIKIRNRCNKLRKLLEIDDLPNLRNLAVRNSFEHVDERIDKFVEPLTHKNFLLEMMSVSPSPPKEGTTVLKRFDPNRLSISFANDEIELRQCMHELTLVESRVHLGISKLAETTIALWAT